jgi:hypothetical protein
MIKFLPLSLLVLLSGCITQESIKTPEQAKLYVLKSKKIDNFKKTTSYTISERTADEYNENICILTLKANVKNDATKFKLIFHPYYQVGAGEVAKNHFFNKKAYYLKGFDNDGKTILTLNYLDNRKFLQNWTGNHNFFEDYESNVSENYIKSHLKNGIKIKIEPATEENSKICTIPSIKLKALYETIYN